MARRGKKSRSKSKKGRRAASRDAAEEAPPPGASGEGTPHDQLVDRLTAQAIATADTGATAQGDPAATEDGASRDSALQENSASDVTENEVLDVDDALDPGEELFDLDGAAEAETELHDLDAVPDEVEVFDLDAVAGIEADVLDMVTDEDIGPEVFDLDAGAASEAAGPPAPTPDVTRHDLDADVEVTVEATDSDAIEDDVEVFDLDGVGTRAHDAISPIPNGSVDDAEPHDLDDGAELASQGAEEAVSADRGVTSTPEARALLLAEALSHAEMQEARYRVPGGARTTGRLKGATALVVFALAGLLAVAPPSLLVPDPPARVDAADRRQGIVLTLLLQAEQIEAFRAREQQLPMTLDDVAAHLPGVRYVRSSNRLYQLIAYTQRGGAVVYDSANPGAEFTEAQAGWRAAEGS